MLSWSVKTESPAQTAELGFLLGRLLDRPLVILLSGDLGAGKTCFTQGVARGLDVNEAEPVTSPTYTLMNQYGGRLPLYHFDLYRLNQLDDLVDIDFDDYLHGDGIVVVEWADRFTELDIDGLRVHIEHKDNDVRSLVFRGNTTRSSELLTALEKCFDRDGNS
ncbi:tRNA (adenosine(37)-N6)-threonylcarbamoyltransferase complex ATPase subunit type 1 TsaE [Desulfuromonas sp. AOP6]|uniref:tRNA (adenosine(37)-N6)-threonylcarbamoyltransferase complex ATPase subunit type 1 TsaE n=1 Tax=Desulfuromonas sp. AOP6 TaxID=1566351 RepID=UPI001271A83E|nr:tRNA (adenosine(37)-N6)-threonylcarbamoyltransferase complex ATPase subunit type 1 TsaE [Desulfuromonas sp. AOP6]BCA80407.1 tRNa (adenosine (37)-N6)-threonylcarbamoyltransferase complex ATPase subunit type 1 TsaE [Desulfuromonas sp. AOP6]